MQVTSLRLLKLPLNLGGIMSYVIRTLVVTLTILLLSPGLSIGAGAAGKTESSPKAYTYITNLRNGSIVQEVFTVELNLRGMILTRQQDKGDNKGHYHVLVDGSITGDFDKPLVTLKNAIDLRDGSNSVKLKLSKGIHTIQVVMGDHGHMLHTNPVMTNPITIFVGIMPQKPVVPRR